ncbi:MAG: hypothetical protein LKI80_16620 [Sporolactobacillus sp.]|nr:hypothetical protein [Sporolactobacillus sp.]
MQNGRGKVDIVFKLTTDGVTRFDRDRGYLLGDDLVAQRDEGIAVYRMAYDEKRHAYFEDLDTSDDQPLLTIDSIAGESDADKLLALIAENPAIADALYALATEGAGIHA